MSGKGDPMPGGIYRGDSKLPIFTEPMTAWDNYIPCKPTDRERSRKIWADAGERLGLGSVEYNGQDIICVRSMTNATCQHFYRDGGQAPGTCSG